MLIPVTVHYRGYSIQSVQVVQLNMISRHLSKPHMTAQAGTTYRIRAPYSTLHLSFAEGCHRNPSTSHNAERQTQHGWYAAQQALCHCGRGLTCTGGCNTHITGNLPSVYKLALARKTKDICARGRRSAWRGRMRSFVVSMTTWTNVICPNLKSECLQFVCLYPAGQARLSSSLKMLYSR